MSDNSTEYRYNYIGGVVVGMTGAPMVVLVGLMKDGQPPALGDMIVLSPDEARLLASYLKDAAGLVEP